MSLEASMLLGIAILLVGILIFTGWTSYEVGEIRKLLRERLATSADKETK